MAFMFENLEVYRKAVNLADQVAVLTERFPRGYYFLVDQLNRAAMSIATNLAEDNGWFTKADRRNFSPSREVPPRNVLLSLTPYSLVPDRPNFADGEHILPARSTASPRLSGRRLGPFV